MSTKVRVVRNGKEGLAGIDFVLSRKLPNREIFEVNLELRQNKTIELEEQPIGLSESIYVNGIYMTEGIDYDYTIDLKTITFNNLVLPNRGHVTINYKYLNVGV